MLSRVFLIVCDDLQQLVRVVHEVFVFAIHQPVIELNELVQNERRDVQISPRVDGHVVEDGLDRAQHLVDAFGGVLEELRADVHLFRVQKRCAVHRRQFVPLVDDLHADADALEALINFSQILKNLKIKIKIHFRIHF